MAWKRYALMSVWSVAALAWVGLIGLYLTEPTTRTWTLAVGAAAVVTEVAFWATAGLLGLTLWESRKKAISWLTRPFRRKQKE